MSWAIRGAVALSVCLAGGLLVPDAAAPALIPTTRFEDDGLAGVAKFLFNQACAAMGGLSREEVSRRFDEQRRRFPKDLPIVLHFWMDVVEPKEANPDSFDDTDARCVMKFEPLGAAVGPDEGTVYPTPRFGSIVHIETTGLGPPVAKLPGVRLEIRPPSRRAALCDLVAFDVEASFFVDGQKFTIDATRLGIQWTSSNTAALAPVSGRGDPGSMGPAGASAAQFFQAVSEGEYAVTVSVARVSPGDLTAAVLSGNAAAAQQIAQELARTSATALVTVVGKPTVDHLAVHPPFRELAVGESHRFQAQAAFREACIPPRDVTAEATWSSATGPLAGSLFVAPETKPRALTVVSTSHPALEADACDIATFAASLTFERMDAWVRAEFGGGSAEATVRVLPPAARDITSDPSVVWTTPTGKSSFQVSEAGPVTVSAIHGPSGASGGQVLRVRPPTAVRLDVAPSSPSVEAGEEVTFRALVSYEQACLLADDVTGIALWPLGPPRVVAEDPAKPILRRATYAGSGKEVSGEASVAIRWPPLVISPSDVVLTLGQEQVFSAHLANARYSKDVSDLSTWPGGRAYRAEQCGVAEITTTHAESRQTATANIAVQVEAKECVAIREALASLKPDHVAESRQWIARRDALLAKGCTCDVPEVPWTSGESTTEQVPDGGPGSGQESPPIQVSVGVAPPMSPSGSGGPGEGCSDPRREPMKTPDGKMACGACRAGFFPNGPDRCATPGEIVDTVACADSRMTKTYDARAGQVICCPPASPVWNPVQGQCALSPEQATGPRPVGPAPEGMGPAIDIGGIFFPPIFGSMPRSQPPGPNLAPAPAPRTIAPSAPPAPSRCHRNPQTGQLHCSSN